MIGPMPGALPEDTARTYPSPQTAASLHPAILTAPVTSLRQKRASGSRPIRGWLPGAGTVEFTVVRSTLTAVAASQGPAC